MYALVMFVVSGSSLTSFPQQDSHNTAFTDVKLFSIIIASTLSGAGCCWISKTILLLLMFMFMITEYSTPPIKKLD